jgi:hypothetical protein
MKYAGKSIETRPTLKKLDLLVKNTFCLDVINRFKCNATHSNEGVFPLKSL